MLSFAQSIHSTKFTMDSIWICCPQQFDSPRKTLMEALSAWTLLKPLLLPPGRWLLPSPSLSRITRLSLLIQLIPQLSSHPDSPSTGHCNADRVYERTTRRRIGRTKVNSASYWTGSEVSKLTCWFGSLLHCSHPLHSELSQTGRDVARDLLWVAPCEPNIISAVTAL